MLMFTKHISIDEFRSRRQKLCSAIDHQGIVLIQGAPEAFGNSTFAQYKDFLYLCGLESPRAYLLIDGKNAHTTLYLQHGASMIRESPKPLPCAENAEYIKDLTGVDSVRGVEELGGPLSEASLLYTPFHPEARSANRKHLVRWAVRLSADPWDTCATRSAQFVDTIKRQFPQLHIMDLVPLMDELRLIKSPAEIALLRRAGELSAVAVTEAMRSTRPGIMEYQLAAIAQYYYFAGGAKERAYRTKLC